MVGTNGQPRGPHPHVHILPCPYDTPPWRADSPYSRGTLSGGQVTRPMPTPISLFEMYCPLWVPVVLPTRTNAFPSGFTKNLPVKESSLGDR